MRQAIYLVVALFPLLAIGQVQSNNEFAEDEIIDLPVGRFPDPECDYNVRRNDRNGRKITGQIRVGEPLYHRWECNYGEHNADMYCMMVHNCTVSSVRNGRNDQLVPIIDEFGCSLFPGVLPHVTYHDDLEGGILVNAFSLDIEEHAIYFQCNIKLLLKLNGVCRRPQCVPLEWFQQSRPHSRALRLL